MSDWFLLAVHSMPIGDVLSGMIGKKIPKRDTVQIYGPLASEEAARQSGADLMEAAHGIVTSVVMFQGVKL